MSNIVPPGHGSHYWLVGDQLTFKVTGQSTGGAYAVAEDYIVPQQGPPPHVHAREDECFYVIEGEFLFASGGRALVGGPGTAVYLPRGVPHVFKNVGQTPGRFLLLAAPAGFEAMVAEAGEAVPRIPFDKAVGPEDVAKLMAVAPTYGLTIAGDWTPSAPSPVTAKDRALWVLGLHVTIKLTAADTGGTLSLAEVRGLPGQGVPAHSHRAMDELFYVLEGTWEFTVDGRPTNAPAGTFVHVPKGATHAFKNVGEGRGCLLDYHLPGGFEAFFEEAGVAAGDEEIPPAAAPPDMAKLIALFNKHGMDVPARP